jgi:hypothetical protein
VCGLYPLVGRVGDKERSGGKPALCIHTRRDEKVTVCASSLNSNASADELAAPSAQRACAVLAYEEVVRGVFNSVH